MPVCGYGDVSDLDMTKTHTLTVVDTIEDPRLAGYHAGLQLAGYAFGRSLPESRVISHEALEMVADPYGQLWEPWEDGKWVAREIADPVESDTYDIDVTLFGVTRPVTVSNFVYPQWFGMPNADGSAKLDHLGLCTEPFEVRGGGYIITRDAADNVVNVYGAKAGIVAGARKVTNDPFSRTARRFSTSAAGTPKAG